MSTDTAGSFERLDADLSRTACGLYGLLTSELEARDLPALDRDDIVELGRENGLATTDASAAFRELWDANQLARYRGPHGFMVFLPRTQPAVLRALEHEADREHPDPKAIGQLNKIHQEVRD